MKITREGAEFRPVIIKLVDLADLRALYKLLSAIDLEGIEEKIPKDLRLGILDPDDFEILRELQEEIRAIIEQPGMAYFD